MKKGFTLIELLVVIAIIAILAAILFPVFAQAKVAAKKAAALSNQKQIALAIHMYASDYDDTLPRNDGCQDNSSLNPALNDFPFNPGGPGCMNPGPFMYRMNHYAWPKWILPYTKNTELFVHPGRAKEADHWNRSGMIMGGFALNLGMTGALNTYDFEGLTVGKDQPVVYGKGAWRNSWLGGRMTSVPSVAEAMILFDFSKPNLNFAPIIVKASDANSVTQTVYPSAVREWWARNLMNWTTCTAWDMAEISNEADPRATFGGGLTIGFMDGHAKNMKAQEFLSKTPTAAEYVVGSLPADRMCGATSGTLATTDVNTNLDYPFWGLGG